MNEAEEEEVNERGWRRRAVNSNALEKKLATEVREDPTASEQAGQI